MVHLSSFLLLFSKHFLPHSLQEFAPVGGYTPIIMSLHFYTSTRLILLSSTVSLSIILMNLGYGRNQKNAEV